MKIILILFLLMSFCFSENSIEMSIEALDNVSINDEVTFGLPFPKGIFTGKEDIIIEIGTSKKIFTEYDIISKWHDGSVRVILVRFKIDLIRGENKKCKVLWGDFKKEREEILEKEKKEQEDKVSNKISENIPDWQKEALKRALMTAESRVIKSNKLSSIKVFVKLEPKWYCYSKVWGDLLPSEENNEFSKYEDRLLSSFHVNVKSQRKSGKAELSYYDLAHTLFQAFLRSGKKEYFISAHDEAKRFIKEEIIHDGHYKGQHINGKGIPLPWRGLRLLYIEGLIDDYILTGDKESFETAKDMAEAYLKGIRRSDMYVNERNPGWPIVELLSIYELTGDKRYFDKVKEIVDIVLDWQDKKRGGWIRVYEDKEECPHGHKGGSPFMTTILMEGLIKYHKITGDEKVKESIIKGNDWLINEAYLPDQKTFVYIQCPERQGNVYSLNPMFMEMLGYAYHLTKDEKYLNVAKGVLSDTLLTGNFANHLKEFTQCFRSSGRGLYYLVKKE
jgi:rhamnogalacturonyl hydrolase YesR